MVRRPHRRLLQRVSLRRWRATARAAGLDEGAEDLVRVRVRVRVRVSVRGRGRVPS